VVSDPSRKMTVGTSVRLCVAAFSLAASRAQSTANTAKCHGIPMPSKHIFTVDRHRHSCGRLIQSILDMLEPCSVREGADSVSIMYCQTKGKMASVSTKGMRKSNVSIYKDLPYYIIDSTLTYGYDFYC
jgi:hypothetical protein